MRKQELVHLHGLLIEVTRSLVDQGTVSADIWNEYDALDINPHSMQDRKSAHKEAVLFLAIALRTTLEQLTEEQSTMPIQ